MVKTAFTLAILGIAAGAVMAAPAESGMPPVRQRRSTDSPPRSSRSSRSERGSLRGGESRSEGTRSGSGRSGRSGRAERSSRSDTGRTSRESDSQTLQLVNKKGKPLQTKKEPFEVGEDNTAEFLEDTPKIDEGKKVDVLTADGKKVYLKDAPCGKKQKDCKEASKMKVHKDYQLKMDSDHKLIIDKEPKERSDGKVQNYILADADGEPIMDKNTNSKVLFVDGELVPFEMDPDAKSKGKSKDKDRMKEEDDAETDTEDTEETEAEEEGEAAPTRRGERAKKAEDKEPGKKKEKERKKGSESRSGRESRTSSESHRGSGSDKKKKSGQSRSGSGAASASTSRPDFTEEELDYLEDNFITVDDRGNLVLDAELGESMEGGRSGSSRNLIGESAGWSSTSAIGSYSSLQQPFPSHYGESGTQPFSVGGIYSSTPAVLSTSDMAPWSSNVGSTQGLSQRTQLQTIPTSRISRFSTSSDLSDVYQGVQGLTPDERAVAMQWSLEKIWDEVDTMTDEAAKIFEEAKELRQDFMTPREQAQALANDIRIMDTELKELKDNKAKLQKQYNNLLIEREKAVMASEVAATNARNAQQEYDSNLQDLDKYGQELESDTLIQNSDEIVQLRLQNVQQLRLKAKKAVEDSQKKLTEAEFTQKTAEEKIAGLDKLLDAIEDKLGRLEEVINGVEKKIDEWQDEMDYLTGEDDRQQAPLRGSDAMAAKRKYERMWNKGLELCKKVKELEEIASQKLAAGPTPGAQESSFPQVSGRSRWQSQRPTRAF